MKVKKKVCVDEKGKCEGQGNKIKWNRVNY